MLIPFGLFWKPNKVPLGFIGIAVITLAELIYGWEKVHFLKKNLEALKQFLVLFELFRFDYNCVIEYGETRIDFEKKGTSIGALDRLIEAHAKSLSHILVRIMDTSLQE